MQLEEFHDRIRHLVSADGKSSKCFCCLTGQLDAEVYRSENFYLGWKIYCTSCNMIDYVLDPNITFFVSKNMIIS